MAIFVLLPAFNEQENIDALLTQIGSIEKKLPLRCKPLNVILVDDGSTDRTVQTAQKFSALLPIYIERHPSNFGLGTALRTGLKKVLELSNTNEDLLITMDADNSHPPELILELIQRAEENRDIVVASRYTAGGKEVGLSLMRTIFSRAANAILKIFKPVPGVQDYTSGYRLIRIPVLKELGEKTNQQFFRENSFACTAELLIKLAELGAKCAEAPLTLRYDLKKGKSKMKVAYTISRYLTLLR